jgi:hypothetical protein
MLVKKVINPIRHPLNLRTVWVVVSWFFCTFTTYVDPNP